MTRSRVALAMLAVALAVSAVWGCSGGPHAAGSFSASVVRVVDGDTIVVAVAHRHETVRILGVNTPETRDPRKGVECYGPEASAYTHARLPAGTRVRVETDAEARDKYGRLLAYVYVNDTRFDDELLRLGYGRLLIIPPNGVYAREMLEAELDARAARRGLWGAC